MILVVETLSSLARQPTDSQVEEKPEWYYLINSDYITEMYDIDGSDSEIHYKFNVYSDRKEPFVFTVEDAAPYIVNYADTAAASPKIALDVFEDSLGNPVQSFNQVTGLTPVTWYFDIKDITWAEGSDATAKAGYSRIFICKGGNKIVPYIVDHTVIEIWLKAAYGDQL